jgi:hypothetical protein
MPQHIEPQRQQEPQTPLPPEPPPPEPPKEPADLAAQITLLSRELAQSRDEITRITRDRDVQRRLIEAGALDIDAAATLVAKQLAESPALTPTKAVREVARAAPMLFRPSASQIARDITGSGGEPRGASMTPAPSAAARGAQQLTDAARDARARGDRRSLMDYLRLRRLPS